MQDFTTEIKTGLFPSIAHASLLAYCPELNEHFLHIAGLMQLVGQYTHTRLNMNILEKRQQYNGPLTTVCRKLAYEYVLIGLYKNNGSVLHVAIKSYF